VFSEGEVAFDGHAVFEAVDTQLREEGRNAACRWSYLPRICTWLKM
jgi:hypothetical protein